MWWMFVHCCFNQKNLWRDTFKPLINWNWFLSVKVKRGNCIIYLIRFVNIINVRLFNLLVLSSNRNSLVAIMDVIRVLHVIVEDESILLQNIRTMNRIVPHRQWWINLLIIRKLHLRQVSWKVWKKTANRLHSRKNMFVTIQVN